MTLPFHNCSKVTNKKLKKFFPLSYIANLKEISFVNETGESSVSLPPGHTALILMVRSAEEMTILENLEYLQEGEENEEDEKNEGDEDQKSEDDQETEGKWSKGFAVEAWFT